jgi:hypothetical protein
VTQNPTVRSSPLYAAARSRIGRGNRLGAAHGYGQWRNGGDHGSNVSAGQRPFQQVRKERPQQDSNLRTRLRRPLLYPLSYGGPARARFRGMQTRGA